MENEFSSNLNSVMSDGNVSYFGCVIKKTTTGYLVHGKDFPTLDEAKKELDSSFKQWNKIIEKCKI